MPTFPLNGAGYRRSSGGGGGVGPRGPAGPIGATGPAGPQGPAGAQGLQGIQGLPGADGVDGADGTNGAPGAVGPAGQQGIPGQDGADGAVGPIGPRGPIGPTGAQGIQGATGLQGASAPAATSIIANAGIAPTPYSYSPAILKGAVEYFLRDAVVGVSISDRVLTFTQEDSSVITITLPEDQTSPPAQTHNRYFAYSTDNTFTTAEFTSSTTGSTSTTEELALPSSIASSPYIAFAVPNDTGDITSITPAGGFNELPEFERVAGTITISGAAYKVWRSTETWIGSAIQGSTWRLEQ